MSLEYIESCGGDYVELIDFGNSGNTSHDRRMTSNVKAGKENSFNSRRLRSSLYRGKLDNIQSDQLQPLRNPYRTSEYDQMPVRVFPLPRLNENNNTCDKLASSRQKLNNNNYKTTPRKVTWGEVNVKSMKETSLTPRNRATSCDDLILTSSCRYATRSTLKQLKEITNLDESNFSISSNEEKNITLSQTLMRNKLRSSKTRKYRQRLNAIFTKSTKSKCKSEYALNEAQFIDDISIKKKKNISSENQEMPFCNEDSSLNKSTFSRKRRLSSIRSRISKKFGKDEKRLDVMDRGSPWKRKNAVICNAMCENFDIANNNQTMTLRDVLNNTELCEEFRQFLSNEHSDENLDFWIICERYRTTNDRNLADIIFRQFLGSGAPREVNIDAKTRSTLDQNLKHLDNSSFDSAQECIYKLMEEDSFRRFCWTRRTKKQRV